MGEFGIKEIIGLVTSFAIGWTVNWAWSKYDSRRKEKQQREFLRKFEGWWLQRIEGQEDRIFSYAEFYFNEEANIYNYSGRNFYNTGDTYYKFRTVALEVDRKNERLLYIYRTTKEATLEK